MKKELILGSLLLMSGLLNAQVWDQTANGNSLYNNTYRYGNVGIGTTNPVYKLDIYGGNANIVSGSNGYTYVGRTTGLSTSDTYFYHRITQGYHLIGSNRLGTGPRFNLGFALGGNDDAGSVKMTIDTNGMVGIAATTLPYIRLRLNMSAGTTSSSYWGIRSAVTKAAPTPGGAAGSEYVALEGNALSNYNADGTTIGLRCTAANGQFNTGGDFTASGGNVSATANNYGVRSVCSGTTYNYGLSSTASGGVYTYAVFGVASGATMNYGIYGAAPSLPNGFAGYFVGDVNRTGIDNFSSDQKLKKDIKPLTDAMTTLLALKPSTYKFRTDEFVNMNLPAGKQMGLIAQDLEKVLPELVANVPANVITNNDGTKKEIHPDYKAVQYISLIPLLIAGIQEQQAEVEAQKKIIEEQAKVYTALQRQLDEQKALIQQLSQRTGLINDAESGIRLSQNEPNPFSQETVIRYTLPENTNSAVMYVYDLSGKQITSYALNQKGAGAITITAERLAPGIYIYSIVADGKVTDSKHMIVAGK